MPSVGCEFALKDGVLEFKEPARKLLSTWVHGTVVNSFTGGRNQQDWKRTVASAVKTARDGSPWDPLDLYAVSLEFRFHVDNHGSQELDVENYVKPVVDAVAAGLFLDEEKDPSGIERWDFPDSNFRTLLIHRAADPKDKHGEGVHISVSVREGPQEATRSPALHGRLAAQSAHPADRAGAQRRASFPYLSPFARVRVWLRRAGTLTGSGVSVRSPGKRIPDGDRFVTPSELGHYIKNYGAYHAMGSQAYHTDLACIWGTRIKCKNLRRGFGKDGKLCPFCRPPSWSPT